MFIIRIIIFTAPLLVFPLLFNFLMQPFFKKALPLKESFFFSAIMGLGLLAYIEFLLLQFFNFSLMLIIFSLIVESVFLVVYKKIASFFFDKTDSVLGWQPAPFKYPNSIVITYIFIAVIIWYLASAMMVFFNPSIWWDEITHWVPKAKILVESGSFQEINYLSQKEYPRLWPIILANFMMVQEKLTHLVPLLLHFLFWIFTLYTSFRIFVFRKTRDLLVLALILIGVFSLGSFSAPYADLAQAVFYSSALILMLQMIGRKISWLNMAYVGLLLGGSILIRADGLNHALVSIIAFCLVVFFINKILALKSFIFLSIVSVFPYISWRLYLLSHTIYSPEIDQAQRGLSLTLTSGGFMLDKALRIFQYTLIQMGNLNKPYFILFIFLLVGFYSLIKKRSGQALLFSALVILGNYLLIFIELWLFTLTDPSDPGRIYWFLDGSYTRLILHFLPFAFFTSAYLLYETNS